MADLGDLSANVLISRAEGRIQHTVANGTSRWTWNHRLAGTVAVDTLPAVKRVVVLTRGKLQYVGSTISASDGTWEIKGLPKVLDGVTLVAIAFDESGTYNAEIADHVVMVS